MRPPAIEDGRPRVAVIVPCHNEARSVARVVQDFRAALPEAEVYVYDNRSSDGTAEVAARAGATVRVETRLGKGHVVRRMFADVDADVYVMVDGDDTYDAATGRRMVDLLLERQLDMVVGRREAVDAGAAYRPGHTLGNTFFTSALRTLFGGEFTDVLSGYRVMSRRFVKSFPVRSDGFEIETELTVHAVEIDAPCAEVPTPYRSRGEDSASKLRTYRDGTRILLSTVRLFKQMRPMQFFGGLFCILTAIAVGLGIPVIEEFARTGLVPRFPTAILASAIQIVAFICLTAGLVIKSVEDARQEARRLAYLRIGPSEGAPPRPVSESRPATADDLRVLGERAAVPPAAR